MYRRILIFKILIVALMIIVGVIALILNIKSSQTSDPETMVKDLNKVIIYLSIKVALDTIIEVMFVLLVIFMINYKRKSSKLSSANKIVIIFVSLLFLTCFF